VQSRVIRERLMREAEVNVAIKVADTPGGEAFEVSGRGELADGRADREHAPRRVRAVDLAPARDLARGKRQRLEPIEEVTIDVDDEYSARSSTS
jgi:GTP-binding protein